MSQRLLALVGGTAGELDRSPRRAAASIDVLGGHRRYEYSAL
jgi:hypothetical protein